MAAVLVPGLLLTLWIAGMISDEIFKVTFAFAAGFLSMVLLEELQGWLFPKPPECESTDKR